jgi:hypothetical protein
VTERRDLTRWRGENWSVDLGTGVQPYDFRVIPWTPDESAAAFLDRYRELTESDFKSPLLDRLWADARMAA